MLLQVVQSKEARKTPREMIYRDGEPCFALYTLAYAKSQSMLHHSPHTIYLSNAKEGSISAAKAGFDHLLSNLVLL